jgi:hypothetical protein
MVTTSDFDRGGSLARKFAIQSLQFMGCNLYLYTQTRVYFA